MRIFERLRGKDREQSGIEPKLTETIVTELLSRIDAETPAPPVADRSACCSCCSADAEKR
jgi:hypothetical protein